ncbi:MAG: methyltransferase domain-containing protein [Lacunisphaera sp.]|nr:methyltransferase domain-containing protein [Lacunisphaera sp.]
MPRQLQPELLDNLPAEHPDAVRSRRDLRLINALMGNHRWLARTLAGVLRDGDRVLELGAGTGELGRRLAATGRPVDGLDLAPRPPDWPPGPDWHSANLLTFAGYGRYDAVIGNLIFHHFSDKELAALGRSLGESVRVIVACEPARSKFSQRLFAFIAPLFRANRVTLHDAPVSIAAGFSGDELPRSLGLDPAAWRWQCRTTVLGAYRLVAIRAH